MPKEIWKLIFVQSFNGGCEAVFLGLQLAFNEVGGKRLNCFLFNRQRGLAMTLSGLQPALNGYSTTCQAIFCLNSERGPKANLLQFQPASNEL